MAIMIFLYLMSLWVWNLSNTQVADSSAPQVIYQGHLMIFSLWLAWYGGTKVTLLICVILQKSWLKG